MNDPLSRRNFVSGDDLDGRLHYHKRDFWIKQRDIHYSKPHFRLEKSAVILNRLARDSKCKLLDVGCGPAALQDLLAPNITYYGIDIAIQRPAPNLIETDFLETPIGFGDQRFDFVSAQGIFEYVGDFQHQKLTEIADVLKDDGTALLTYVNFGHRRVDICEQYNNVQPLDIFRSSLVRHFRIDRSFPTSHNWNHWEPGREVLKAINMPLNVNVPLLSRKLAVEYFFLCSPRRSPVPRQRSGPVAGHASGTGRTAPGTRRR
jgi:SAM-dependent methyltransferase